MVYFWIKIVVYFWAVINIRWDKTAKQVEVQRLHGQRGVNRAEGWDES